MSYPPSSPHPHPWQPEATGGGPQPQGQPGGYFGGEAAHGGAYPGGYPAGGPGYPGGPTPDAGYPGGQYGAGGPQGMYGPQGGYAPQGGYGSQPPYGMPPQQKSGPLVVIISIVVALLVVGGAVAAFLLLGKNDDKPAVATPTQQPNDEQEPVGTDEPLDAPDEPGPGIETIFTFNPYPGQCLNWPRFYGGAVGQPEEVECSKPHDGEVMVVAPLPTAEYPGESKLLNIIEPLCLDAFKDYVGVDYGEVPYEVYMTGPNQEEYKIGARNYACYAISREAGQLRGSLRGSGN